MATTRIGRTRAHSGLPDTFRQGYYYVVKLFILNLTGCVPVLTPAVSWVIGICLCTQKVAVVCHGV